MDRLTAKERVLAVLDTIDSATMGQLVRVIGGSYSLMRNSVAEMLEAGELTRRKCPLTGPRKRSARERYVYRLAADE